jgi:hypothetical protein
MDRLRQFGLKLMECKRAHEDLDKRAKELNGLIKRTENAILAMLKSSGVQTVQVEDPENDAKYTFAQGGGERFNVSDMDAYVAFLRETGDLSFVTSAVRKEAVIEYRRCNQGLLPPGVQDTQYEALSVRTTRVPSKEET